MKISRNWLQTYFEKALPSAQEIADVLTMYAFEVESVVRVGHDDVLDVKVLPNRAHDCLSHRGIARELHVLLGLDMKPESEQDESTEFSNTILAVSIENPAYCQRYTGAILRGVTVKESPAWLKERLEAIGQKSINNIVDATNYILFALGQPLHAFDLGKLIQRENGYSILVRNAKEGEEISALDGKTYTLSSDTLVITDKNCKDNKILGIAGIKGGKAAEIDNNTTDILVEAAHFDPVRIRMTAKKLGLRTDASVRFENGITPELTMVAMQSVCALIAEIALGNVEALIDVKSSIDEKKTIDVSFADIEDVLGVSIDTKKIMHILQRIGCEVVSSDKTLSVTPPAERLDMVIKEDVIEEVGRVYGYSNISPVEPPNNLSKPDIDTHTGGAFLIRKTLVELGFSEVYTYTFGNVEGSRMLENPIASDKQYLRGSLKDGLTESLKLNAYNAPLLGIRDIVKIFEIGKVFSKDGECLHVGIAVTPVGKIKNVDTVISHLLESVQRELETKLGVPVSSVLDKNTHNMLEINLDETLKNISQEAVFLGMNGVIDTNTRFSTISSYPFMLRDVAVFVPEGITQDDVMTHIKREAGDLLVRLDLFDVFTKKFEDGNSKTSYAFSLVFQSNEKTLSDDEVGEIMKKVADTLNAQEGWQVR